MKKFTYEEVKNFIENLGYELISKEYIGSGEKLILKDKYNYYYVSNLENLKSDYKPNPFSKKNPYTIENIKLWLKLNNINLILVTKKYEGIYSKLTLKDKNEYYYVISLHDLKNGHRIPRFADNSNPYTIQNIKLWLKLNDKSFELLSKDYENNHKKLKWKCLNNNCEEIFEKNWGEVLQGKGCPYCVGQKASISNCLATKNPELAKEWHPTKNGDLTPYDVTCGSGKKVWWKCNECGHEWPAIISNRTGYYKTGCPQCSESKGEKRIVQYLRNIKIIHQTQYSFNDLIGLGGGLLKFDNSIFKDKYKLNLMGLIEYDGIQHFKWIPGMMTYEDFEKLQIHDHIKNNYCKQNNIPLLRIPYWEFDNIENLLTDWLFK